MNALSFKIGKLKQSTHLENDSKIHGPLLKMSLPQDCIKIAIYKLPGAGIGRTRTLYIKLT